MRLHGILHRLNMSKNYVSYLSIILYRNKMLKVRASENRNCIIARFIHVFEDYLPYDLQYNLNKQVIEMVVITREFPTAHFHEFQPKLPAKQSSSSSGGQILKWLITNWCIVFVLFRYGRINCNTNFCNKKMS